MRYLNRKSRGLSFHLKKIRYIFGFVALFGVIGGGGLALFQQQHKSTKNETAIRCHSPYIIDGDTLSCAGKRIRLIGIDAPEMPGHCREGRACTPGDPYAARQRLVSISRQQVECFPEGKDRYDRILARCKTVKEDLSCAMLDAGFAVKRYSTIWCPIAIKGRTLKEILFSLVGTASN